jgi:hypothetical protein
MMNDIQLCKVLSIESIRNKDALYPVSALLSEPNFELSNIPRPASSLASLAILARIKVFSLGPR